MHFVAVKFKGCLHTYHYGYLEEIVGLLHFNVFSLLRGRADVLGQEVNRFGCGGSEGLPPGYSSWGVRGYHKASSPLPVSIRILERSLAWSK